jgi:MFS transporter, SP family, xylose:H+ symportor
LAKIGGKGYAEAALQEVEESLREESRRSRQRSELLSPAVRHVLAIGIVLAVLQQWSGINILFNYAAEVYRNAGYGVSDVMFNIVITGAINLLLTLVALGLVDRFGRRPLMLFGCAGIGFSHLMVGFTYRAHIRGFALLALTLAAIGCYAMSLAPVTWVLISGWSPSLAASIRPMFSATAKPFGQAHTSCNSETTERGISSRVPMTNPHGISPWALSLPERGGIGSRSCFGPIRS